MTYMTIILTCVALVIVLVSLFCDIRLKKKTNDYLDSKREGPVGATQRLIKLKNRGTPLSDAQDTSKVVNDAGSCIAGPPIVGQYFYFQREEYKPLRTSRVTAVYSHMKKTTPIKDLVLPKGFPIGDLDLEKTLRLGDVLFATLNSVYLLRICGDVPTDNITGD